MNLQAEREKYLANRSRLVHQLNSLMTCLDATIDISSGRDNEKTRQVLEQIENEKGICQMCNAIIETTARTPDGSILCIRCYDALTRIDEQINEP